MFSLLGLAYYRRRAARCLLIVISIALAVSLYAGMFLGNASLETAFQDTLDRVAGRAQLQITAVDGVAENVLERVRRLDCVQEAAAVMLRLAPLRLPGETALAVLGVDLLEDDRFREYDLAGEQAADAQTSLECQTGPFALTPRGGRMRADTRSRPPSIHRQAAPRGV